MRWMDSSKKHLRPTPEKVLSLTIHRWTPPVSRHVVMVPDSQPHKKTLSNFNFNLNLGRT